METNHENSLLSVSNMYPEVQVFQVREKETRKKNSGMLTWYQQGISKYPESELINTLS
jgi:hypothetical protein